METAQLIAKMTQKDRDKILRRIALQEGIEWRGKRTRPSGKGRQS